MDRGIPVAEQAQEVGHEIASGRPGRASRRWLGWVSLGALLLFLIDTYLVANGSLLHGFDEPVERTVQRLPWGPLTYVMTLTNVTAGVIQDTVGVLIVLTLLAIERRAGLLMAFGAVGSLIDQFVKVSIARHRPTPDLVQILNPSNGFSYPSGHAVFFTWLYFMFGMSLAPKIAPRWRPLLWSCVAFFIFLACLGRVWAGAHWPSDVIGGFLLAMSWCAFVLWLPERWLPSPSWASWWRRRKA